MPQFRNATALGYLGRFLQQWGITSATGYMWSLVPEVVSYGEYQSKNGLRGLLTRLWACSSRLG